MIKLEVGKTYRNRMGTRVRIIAVDNGDTEYPRAYGDDNLWYPKDGSFSFWVSPHSCDLIEEVVETPAPVVGYTGPTRDELAARLFVHLGFVDVPYRAAAIARCLEAADEFIVEAKEWENS